VKYIKKLSILLVVTILLGLAGAATPSHVEAQKLTTRMTVLELRTSPT